LCVRRELEEETGFKAKKIKKLISYWPTPAFADEVLHVYAATGLTESKKSPDEDEFIDHKIFTFKEALKLVEAGKIMDSKTIIALLYWKAFSETKRTRVKK
jgi:ADP-ribose pyrophosphatase